MSKRSRQRKKASHAPTNWTRVLFSLQNPDVWLPLLLALIAFLVFWPSLYSGFVYDMAIIMDEGFVTSLSNIWPVLSLKVLSMNTMTGARPLTILYFMFTNAIWGSNPFGFHLGSNLLHAANVGLLFVFLRRIVQPEIGLLLKNDYLKILLATAAVTLVFALHPMVVETVAEISYSSDLLVTLFTFLTLLTAISFDPEDKSRVVWKVALATFLSFAAVCCKESGITAVFLLGVYWFLFRRHEAKIPWLWFLGVTFFISAVFMVFRLMAVPANPAFPVMYMNGSLVGAMSEQPRLWVYMMGQMLWPTALSADYTLPDMEDHSPVYAIWILIAVVAVQGWFAWKSRLGAFGIAIYWLGLSTVSNLMPLYRIEADRFYYLPLAGCMLQLLALLLMLRKWDRVFWTATAAVFVLVGPLTLLSLDREPLFRDEFSLWNETKDASPHSAQAHSNLCVALAASGHYNAAIEQALQALALNPYLVDTHYNLGTLYLQAGRVDEAIVQYQKAFLINPNYLKAHENLGVAYMRKGRLEDAIAEFQVALRLRPDLESARKNLAMAESQLQDKKQKAHH